MKVESYYQTYPLNGAGIDELSAAIDSRLEPIGIERENRLRIRLSMEEALLRMRDHFGENKEVTLTIAGKMARPYVQIALEGPIFNPLSKTAVELDDYLRDLIKKKASSELGKNIVLKEHVDKSMLGGIIMSTKDERIDASLLTQVEKTREALK